MWLWLVTSATPAMALDTTPPRTEPGELSVSIGAEYTTGEYGATTRTDIWYFPLMLSYETERWFGWLTIPYLMVEGPGDVVILGAGMGGRRSTTATTTARRTESGLGDIVAGTSYRVLTQTETRPALDLTGKLYFGTADETQGLGTGENDYAVQLGLSKHLSVLDLTATAGYLVTGDPEGIQYEDVFYGRLEVERGFGRNSVGLAFDAQQAATPDGDAPARITGYLSVRPGQHARLTGYLLKGLSDASPDWGAGVTFSLLY